MKMSLVEAPFSNDFLPEFGSATKVIFGSAADQSWLDALTWRLQKMPDVTVFVVKSDNGVAAYKAGYAIAYDRYYSWLGGVRPQYRRQGLGKQLMDAQHEWLKGSRFQLLETHVEQKNRAMIQLNLNSGFAATGEFMKGGDPYAVMQKVLNAPR